MLARKNWTHKRKCHRELISLQNILQSSKRLTSRPRPSGAGLHCSAAPTHYTMKNTFGHKKNFTKDQKEMKRMMMRSKLCIKLIVKRPLTQWDQFQEELGASQFPRHDRSSSCLQLLHSSCRVYCGAAVQSGLLIRSIESWQGEAECDHNKGGMYGNWIKRSDDILR